ncbi:protein ref(2)P-like [Plodia interpunctella]|uniref:protein ref(2)P-like n=1 Tax=Plodia interpunctella TaxID=58824 RepID=UPI002368A460|nr:protein ref(2)P-like [Plodia interpunctella]
MVNYCCVSGCGRNSRNSKQLNFYSLPRERSRQKVWFQAAGREDLLEKSQDKPRYRFCSRHFEPSCIKFKHLKVDAVPTLRLPGSNNENKLDSDGVLEHDDVVCNNCKDAILGFRYKCVICPDYDLCSVCETVQTHSEHYMLRISRPIENETTEKLLKKLKNILADSCEISSDDEPITKYKRNYDSGVDLSEDLKYKIRKEVTRALSSKKKIKVKTGKKRESESSRPVKRQCRTTESDDEGGWPEMVFVDEEVPEVKTEQHEAQPGTSAQGIQTDVSMEQPLIHVKISEDFNDLMIEVPEQSMYKYS